MSNRGLIKMNALNTGNQNWSNVSVTLTPDELQRMLNNSQNFLSSSINDTFGNSMGINDNYSIDERSIFEMSSTENYSALSSKTGELFPQFSEILQSRTNDSEVFDTIQDLIQVCSGVLDDAQKDFTRGGAINIRKRISDLNWLDREMKTWKLLHALYRDRIFIQKIDMDFDEPALFASEKEIISHLYSINSTLREYQLMVDWLEACYEKSEINPQALKSSDRSVGWENTLFELQNKVNLGFNKTVDLVTSLDPDAPIREKRHLHSLDERDNLKLSKHIFIEIRQGRIDEAMALCKYFGQTWRAAILEGWRLHEDPNYEAIQSTTEKLPIEGNPRRDIWKKCAWLMADSKKQDDYTRAIAGVFCGHLESLITLPGSSWEDLLWSYLKVQIDIRVESEIRSCYIKSLKQMPEAYMNSKMSLDQIFDELMVHNDASVRDYANSKIGLIQKHLILDNISDLLHDMETWVAEEDYLAPQMLRFWTHLILFFRQIGRIDREESANIVISAYVECLIEMSDPQLTAFYASALPTKSQIHLYSKLLDGITETSARSEALEKAISAGLDVENITRHNVESMQQVVPSESEAKSQIKIGNISEIDHKKIRSLEWLTFLPTQSGELLWQTNAMIRNFLAEGKTECVRNAFEMVGPNCVSHLIKIYGSPENFPCMEDCAVKEYLCYKVYLVAINCFNEWSRLYHNKPKEPDNLSPEANFTERIAFEHKEQAYKCELNRWKMNLEEQSNMARDALFNVLLFPEKGWLIDPDNEKLSVNINELKWENRQIQMEKLRSIYIPEVVLLLHRVLHYSEDYINCIKLSNELANETRQLYKVYTKHKMAELLSKLADSSLQLLNQKSDPWGYPVTI